MPGSILEIENVNLDSDGNPRQLWTFPISAKRYALYTLTEGRPALVRVIDLDDRGDAEPADEPRQLDELADAKQHGLGHLLNPTDPESESRDWIGELWDYIVRTDALGQQAAEPKWLDLPAVGRFNVSNHLLLRAFKHFNRGKPHWRQVRPFNFLLVAHSGALDRGGLTSRSCSSRGSSATHASGRSFAGSMSTIRSGPTASAPAGRTARRAGPSSSSTPTGTCRRLPRPPRGEVARTRRPALRQADGRAPRPPARHPDPAAAPPRQGGTLDRPAGGGRRRPRRDPHRVPRARARHTLAAHVRRAPHAPHRTDSV